MAGKKKASFTKTGIEALAQDKPVIYKIRNRAGTNTYTGVAKRGRVAERLSEHMPGSRDHIPGAATVEITQYKTIAEARAAEARSMKPTLKRHHHVAPNPDGGWDVKRGNAKRASGHFSTKQEAVDAGRVISRNQKTELVIHRKDGTIERTDHVVPSPRGGWDVKRGGASKASRHFSNKEDAVDWGHSVSRKRGSELYVHRSDGTVERKASHSGESFSPKHRDTSAR